MRSNAGVANRQRDVSAPQLALWLDLACRVLCALVMICLTFLVARYRKVFCILMFKCLTAFSVSIIKSLIWYFGSFSIA